jgi:hypothetical protein
VGVAELRVRFFSRYQEFSAELLRVSPLGISAIGFAWLQLAKPDSANATATSGDVQSWESPWVRWLVIASLVLLASSSALATVIARL